MARGVKKSKMVERTRKGLLFMSLAGVLTLVSSPFILQSGAIVIVGGTLAITAGVLLISGAILFVLGRRGFGRSHARAVAWSVITFFAFLGAIVVILALLLLPQAGISLVDERTLEALKAPLVLGLLALYLLLGLPLFIATYFIQGRTGRSVGTAAWGLWVLAYLFSALYYAKSVGGFASLAYISGASSSPRGWTLALGLPVGLFLLIGFLWTLSFFLAFRRVTSGEAQLRVAPSARIPPGASNTSGLECGACGTPLPVGVAHCPACGADPWLQRLKVELPRTP